MIVDFQKVLFDPQVFEINEEKPHAYIKRYESEKDLKENNLVERVINDDWHGIYSEDYNDLNNLDALIKSDLTKVNNVEVPLSIQIQGYGKPKYINTQYPFDGYIDYKIFPKDNKFIDVKNPYMIYLKDLKIDKINPNKKYILNFKGFETALFLFVNSEFVGYSETLYTDSEFDITKFLKDGTNRIAAIVFYYSSSSYILSQDFYRFSGLFRDVTLSELNKKSIFDIEIKSKYKFEKESGTLNVNLTGNIDNLRKEFILIEENNKEILHLVTKDNKISASIDKVNAYSEEKPNLYTLLVKLYDEKDELIEILKEKVGFKEVHIEGTHIIYNGKKLAIRGVDRHERNYKRGRNVTLDDCLFDVKFMKDHNINAIRTSHYPNRNEFYDFADQYGLYIMDEACFESHGSLGSWTNHYDRKTYIPDGKEEWANIALSRIERMYERDKNHPSIFCYSLGNESGIGDTFMKMRQWLKNRNSDVIVHYEGVCGWWPVPGDLNVTDVYSRMYPKVEDIIKYDKENPIKPYLICEYSHSMGNSTGNLDEYVNLFDTCDSFAGGFIWDFIDQGLFIKNQSGKEMLSYGGDYLEKPNDEDFCCNGIIFADRKIADKSSKAKNVKYYYSPISVTISNNFVELINRNLFINLNEYDFIFEVVEDNVTVHKETFKINCEPTSKCKKELSFTWNLNKSNLILFRITALKDGKQIVREEKVMNEGKFASLYNSSKFKVHKGFYNIGVEGDNFIYYFSMGKFAQKMPGLIGIEVNGDQYIKRDILPTLFRPSTSNDIGNKMTYFNNKLLGFSKLLESDYGDIEIDDKHTNEYFEISYKYYVNRKENEFIKVTYHVNKNGTMNVRVHMDPLKDVDDIGIFGLRFSLAKSIDTLTYFGYGPLDNYVDRLGGEYLGIYNTKVKDEYVDYILPQECGNHLGTKYLVLHGANSNLRIFKDKEDFAFKFLENNEFEIENADHKECLPFSCSNYLTIAGFTRGIGGDDSWAAPVHRPYELKANKVYEFSFNIEPSLK